MGAPSLYVVDVIKNILSYLSKLIPNSVARLNELGRGELVYRPMPGIEKQVLKIYGYSERSGESVGNHMITVYIKDHTLKSKEELMKFLYEEKERISKLREPIKLVIND